MCLAIPAKVIEIKDDNLAVVDILGATREASLDLTPQAKLGDYVLIHAGFAIEIVDEEFARETIDLIREFPELADVQASSSDIAQMQRADAQANMQGMLQSLAEEL